MSGPAQNDSGFTTLEDTPLVLPPGQLLANDPAGTTILDIGNATGGTVGYDGNGNIVFTPTADYNGPASFEYLAMDDMGEISVATVSLSVTPVNDAPVGFDFAANGIEDTAFTFNASLFPFGDVDGDTLAAVRIDSLPNAAAGTLLLDGVAVTAGQVIAAADLGLLVYSPAANANGAASFTFSVGDGQAFAAAPSTMTLNIAAVNDKPVAVADSFTFDEDTPLVLSAADLLGNDTDIENGTLSILAVTGAQHGTVVKDAMGNITFTPAADYNGPAQFKYVVSDGQGGFSTGTVNLTITPVNDAPDAVDDGGSAGGSLSLSSVSSRIATNFSSVGQITAGDFNGDGAVDLFVKAVQGFAGGNGLLFGDAGSLTMRLDGGSYAAASASGPELFKLGADNNFTGMGDLDNDGIDDVIRAASGTSLAVLQGDDTNPDAVADQTLYQGVGYSGAGAPVLADFNGDGYADLFVGAANSSYYGNGTAPTSPAMAFWLGSAGGVSGSPTGTAYSGISSVGVSSQFSMAQTLGALDLNGDGYADIVTNVGAANDGQTNYGPAKITFGNAAGIFAANLAGTDGGLILSGFDVAGGNPLARQVAGGGDANGDGLQDLLGWTEGSNTGGFALFGSTGFSAGTSFDLSTLNGTNGVKFTGVSSGVTDMALGDLNGDGIDDIVIGSEGGASGAGKLWVVWGQEGGFSSGSIDLSQTGDSRFITIDGAAGQGIGSALTITDIDGDGLNDLVVGSASGTIDAVSGEVFQGMVAAPLPGYTTFEDMPLTIDPALLLANDSDIDGDTLTITSVQDAVGGSVAIDGNGNVVFTPGTNYSGPASFTYTISDGNGGTDTATARLTVRPDDMALAGVATRVATGMFGISALQTGDVNNDGALDIFAQVQSSSHTDPNHGVILGAAGSLATMLAGGDFSAALANGPATIKFGATNAFAGLAEVNGDGIVDIVHATSASFAKPVLSTLLGGTAVDNTDDGSLLPDIGYGSGLVTPVSGDFNGDGFSDLFVGFGNSTSVFGASATTPALAMWQGSSGGLTAAPTKTAYPGIDPVGVPGGGGSNAAFAMGMIDINGDGYDDLVTNVGARNNGYTNYGPAKITFGNAAGTLEQNLASNAGGLILSNFNFAGGDPVQRYMAAGGDVNGDGIADMAGWAANYSSNATGGFVLFGDDAFAAGGSVDIATLDGQNGVKLTGVSSGINSMALGDLNGDGLADMVVGSAGAASGAGRLWVVWGREGGFSSGSIDLSQESTGGWITLTGSAGQGIGSALTVADIDGDGLNDLVVGSASGTIDAVSGTQFGASIDSLLGAMAAFSAPAGSLETVVLPEEQQQYQLASPA